MSKKSHPGDGVRNCGIRGGGLWEGGFKSRPVPSTGYSVIAALVRLISMLRGPHTVAK
jgi:hypothetical protein